MLTELIQFFKGTIVFLLLPFISFSQNTEGTIDPSSIIKQNLIGEVTASIDDVSWIQGSWVGDAFGGIAEEVWSAPSAGAMMGMFRLINNQDVSFYEMMIIREFENSLVLQLKHFDNDLKGWELKEETVDFPLIKIEKHKIYFDGLTFEKVTENKMIVNVIIEKENPEGVDFIYERHSSQKKKQ